METKGYIYLFQSGNLYKIGTAVDVPKRLKSVQTGSPNTVVCLHQIPSDDPYRAEKFLHLTFGAKRIRNEWFELSEADVNWIMRIQTISSQFLSQYDTSAPKPPARDVAGKRICKFCGDEFLYDTQKAPLKKFCSDDCQMDFAAKISAERYKATPRTTVPMARHTLPMTRRWTHCVVCGKELMTGIGPCCSSKCALNNGWAQSPEQ